ncbi:MAG TPA: phosphotransferase [Spirochaetia bacterium]|nr:phosphotransferase [Spirochaetales bacterium]HRY78912.1 phosphotransferase [Spirochaetia bacterium]
MKTEGNPIRAVMDLFDDRIRREAADRFGMDGDSLEELEGSAYVFAGERRDGKGRVRGILKITPGLRDPGPIMGASRAELEAEVDYVRYLAANRVPAARSLPSLTGADVEEIPIDGDRSFLAYCFEFAEGSMFPDDDLTVFPPGVLREWGRLLGMTHRLAPGFRPRPGARRPDWRGDDHLRSRLFVPASQEAVHRRFDETVLLLESLPAEPREYGIVHGDFHHGNFLAEGERLTLIDFDACRFTWFSMDLATALFNCLPMPRSRTALRRDCAMDWLSRILEGYREERTDSPSLLADLPLFLYVNELLAYSYRYKHWEPEELEDRADYLSSIRERIEDRAPVVEFRPGDLESLAEPRRSMR